jgi:RNA-directed DNA polymerase
MLERGNLLRALQAVERNRGAAGVDGMETSQWRGHLRENGSRIKEQILSGSYEPRPVRRVDIPKAGGGTRMLGIPTVLDRFIQQAIHQTLSPIWAPVFSAHSYGFRPGRNAQQAIKAVQAHVRSGKRWVVDRDLEKFFDRVNHDVLMARIGRRVSDRRVLGLIRRYLGSGIMLGGVVEQRVEGTPQGGPLSPLLSNILLDDLDQELEKRGHRFFGDGGEGEPGASSAAIGATVQGQAAGEVPRGTRAEPESLHRESETAVTRVGRILQRGGNAGRV